MADAPTPYDFQANEPLLIAALEHAACGIAVIDEQGVFTYINPQYAEIYGYQRDELMGQSVAVVLSPSQREDTDGVIRGFRELPSKTSGERQLVKRDGSKVFVQFSVQKMVSQGRTYSLATLQDIGQLRDVRNAAARNEQARHQMMHAALDAVVCFGPDLRITYWNPQAAVMFGTDEQEALGKNVIEEVFGNRFTLSIEPGSLGRVHEMTAIDGEGAEIPVEITVLPIEENSGELYCAYIRDISERKKNEMMLRELNMEMSRNIDQLGKSNLELEQFAYIASHDLQEPLRMVTGFLTQLDKKYHDLLDEKGREYLYYAVDGAVRMRQIILDLLEYSRADKADAPLEDVDLNQVLDGLFRQNGEPLGELGGSISRDAMPVVRARRVPITQVFQNLIGNAIKYHREDVTPEIQIRCVDESSYWKFSVADNGIGISPRHFKKIFVVFQRLHLREQYSGTGIGLAICKKIIEGYGGRIWVESQPGQGSTFYFTIRK